MKTLLNIITVITLTLSVQALAHVGLKASIPADQAMLMKSPKVLQLNYSAEVRAVKVTLKDEAGGKVDFGFKPSNTAQKEFLWDLPQLKPSNYKVKWIVMGKDGHKMKGSYSFMVH